MADLSGKGSEPEEINSPNPNGVSSDESQKKTCADCGTTKTPLWRGGPAGPKSLCNACGIRSRKKRREILGVKKGISENKKVKSSSGGGGSNKNNKVGDGFKKRLLYLGREVMMKRSTVGRPRKRLGEEEEQAAMLLMALSYGSVFA